MTINIDITLGATTVATVVVNSIHIDIVVNGSQIPSPSICERVDECLDIPTANGNYVLKILNGVKSWVAATGGGVWGSITGTLSDQTDLQNALNNKQNALGYTPENIDNKTDVMSGNTTSSVKYLSAKGVYDWVIGLGYLTTSAAAATYATIASLSNYLTITAAASTYATIASLSSYLTTAAAAATYQVILTAANFGAFLNSLSAKTTPTDNDVVGLMDSADSNNSKKITWANIKATLLSYFSGIFSKRIIYDISHSSVTGTSTETILSSTLIPANTFAVGDGFSYYTMLDKSAQTANDTWSVSVYLNATNNLSGTPRLIGSSVTLAANNRWYSQGRDLNTFTAASTIEYLTTGLGIGSDSTSAGVNIAGSPYLSNSCPNIGSDMYFIVTARHTGSSQADTITHRKTVVYLEKA